MSDRIRYTFFVQGADVRVLTYWNTIGDNEFGFWDSGVHVVVLLAPFPLSHHRGDLQLWHLKLSQRCRRGDCCHWGRFSLEFSRCQSPCILNIGWKYRWLYGDIRCLWTSILKYFSDFESEADKEIKEFVGGLVPCMALKDLEFFVPFLWNLTMNRPKTSRLLSFLLEIIMFRSTPYTLASCMNYAYILWNQILEPVPALRFATLHP